jgi:uncharacterized protein YndB with AHSA1/START domain
VTPVPPVRREVVVAGDPALAFRVFTEQLGSWWPLARHSVHGATSSVGFEDDEIVEVAATGERCVWGTVTVREPGRRIAFTWHPGHDADRAGRVTVTFSPREDGTLVTLVHEGWEVYADPAAARAEYDTGWPVVLSRLQTAVATQESARA